MSWACEGCGQRYGVLVRYWRGSYGMWHSDCWSLANGPSDDERIDLGSPRSESVDPSATNTLKGPQISGNEATDVLVRFLTELQRATGDGARKRKAGTKPPWFRDDSHEGAIFSHLTKWKRGELVDPDSGAHPLVHAAWRCLAIACRETGNIPDRHADA